MSAPPKDHTVRICIASEADREAIYRLRHTVYARELGQHPENADERLVDRLDSNNVYVIIKHGDEIAGHISVTPPGEHGYSLEKYVRREDLPFPVDVGTYEVRLLTVRDVRRGGRAALLLLLAALRWIQSQGGTRIIAMGRREVLPFYRKVGLLPLGVVVKSGAVTYELMTATVGGLCAALRDRHDLFERACRNVNCEFGPLSDASCALPRRRIRSEGRPPRSV